MPVVDEHAGAAARTRSVETGYGSPDGGVHVRAGSRTRSSMARPKIRRCTRGRLRWDAPSRGRRDPALLQRGRARCRRHIGSRTVAGLQAGRRVSAPSSIRPAPKRAPELLPPDGTGVLVAGRLRQLLPALELRTGISACLWAQRPRSPRTPRRVDFSRSSIE